MKIFSQSQRQFGSLWVLSFAMFTCLLLVFACLFLIVSHTFHHFWPKTITRIETGDGQTILGELQRKVLNPESGNHEYQVKVGNRELTGADFIWVVEKDIKSQSEDPGLALLERRNHGNFYGIPLSLKTPEGTSDLAREEKPRRKISSVRKEVGKLIDEKEGLINKSLPLYHMDPQPPALAGLETDIARLSETLAGHVLVMRTGGGESVDIPMEEIVEVHTPNRMGLLGKLMVFLERFWKFMWDYPRESNTEGGIFPAMIGTAMLVLIMTLAVVPIGVLVAVYLNEYATSVVWIRFVRMAMNNLAGVPSIVFGMFGLGFFIYTVGSGIDSVFFRDSLPTPTFGTGGLLWASLTLALLTIPVVVISTEEGLRSVPRASRDSALALGATRLQTLLKITVPGALPGILTGVILAISRGAGEVAPLMLTGVVKLVTNPPLDSEFPFLHVERKFMHLGFHIFDAGFQSPNAEAARPVVYATSFFLILMVLALNFTAIYFRQYLKTKNKGAAL